MSVYKIRYQAKTQDTGVSNSECQNHGIREPGFLKSIPISVLDHFNICLVNEQGDHKDESDVVPVFRALTV